jgi:hypothetical protein
MFVAQHEVGGGLDFSGFVAVDTSDRVRPRPRVAAVVVLEPADTLRCAAQKCAIDRSDGLSVGAGLVIAVKSLPVTGWSAVADWSSTTVDSRSLKRCVDRCHQIVSLDRAASPGTRCWLNTRVVPGSPCDECVNATSSHRRHTAHAPTHDPENHAVWIRPILCPAPGCQSLNPSRWSCAPVKRHCWFTRCRHWRSAPLRTREGRPRRHAPASSLGASPASL